LLNLPSTKKKCEYICATQKLHIYLQPEGCLLDTAK
jgi:hypothetical protein